MPNQSQPSPGQAKVKTTGEKQAGEITPDLVQEIADKVYALLLTDLRLERERRRTSPSGPFSGRGGW